MSKINIYTDIQLLQQCAQHLQFHNDITFRDDITIAKPRVIHFQMIYNVLLSGVKKKTK